MARQIATSKEAIGEAPAPDPVEPVAGTENPPPVEVLPDPVPVKPPLLTIQVNQIQKIVFADNSEYHATFGVHEIRDERLAGNLRELLSRPHKRQIFLL